MTTDFTLRTDSYKHSHWRQLPKDAVNAYSYLESRMPGVKTCFCGLQYILKNNFVGKVLSPEKIERARKRVDAHMGPGTYNYDAWMKMYKKYGGVLPLRIRAVREGTVVDSQNVLMDIQLTEDDKDFAFLPNFSETLLSQVWYPTTVATNSWHSKRDIRHWLLATGCSLDGLAYKLHDFGFRGVSSVESAGIGGFAHLVNFAGTDTLEALEVAEEYYRQLEVAGVSIPASEHFTITSWGEENECKAFENMLNEYPTGPMACVSDSFDIFRACSEYWGGELREKVLQRDGFLVIRPDSGDFYTVLPKVMKILWDKFGGTLTDKGYKLLDSHVRVIQGDGIKPGTPYGILKCLASYGFAADNIAFGSGGGLLQDVNRDTFKFAFKCSAMKRGDEWVDVFKNPITDPGKKSKRGKLSLHIELDGSYYTIENLHKMANFKPGRDQLETIFENGELLIDDSMEDIRKRANTYEVRNS